MHLLARASEVRLTREIGGIDNQRASFPMATRVPHPLADVLRKMGPSIQRDDARVVDLLVENHDISRSLDQLKIVVITRGRHWRSAVRSHDTTF